MTWEELLLLLSSMKEQNHSAMEELVTVLWDNQEYYVDLTESLTKGSLCFIPLQTTEKDDV